MKNYKPSSENAWHGRIDEADGSKGFRWHQKVEIVDVNEFDAANIQPGSIAFLGFCSDEGVRRNFGRTGARNGPQYLRLSSSNLAWHFGERNMYDFGDVICDLHDLESANATLSTLVEKLLALDLLPILLGGGHEISLGHYNGIRNFIGNKSIGIINIDAHFDLRAPVNGPNSGTSFFQIADDCKSEGHDFHYMCLGVQEYSNTVALFDKAKNEKVVYVKAEDIHTQPPIVIDDKITEFANRVDYIYLTICLDAFDVSIAPGVSAPSINGLTIEHAFSMIRAILNTRKVISVDIAELNPDHDIDNRTSRLGSLLAFEMLRVIGTH